MIQVQSESEITWCPIDTLAKEKYKGEIIRYRMLALLIQLQIQLKEFITGESSELYIRKYMRLQIRQVLQLKEGALTVSLTSRRNHGDSPNDHNHHSRHGRRPPPHYKKITPPRSNTV